MFGLGPTELIIILAIILIIFGGKRVPELARSLGKGIHEFNKQKEMIQEEYEEVKGVTEMDFESKSESPKSTTSKGRVEGKKKPEPAASEEQKLNRDESDEESGGTDEGEEEVEGD